MDAQQFLAEFGHIANSPGGIARLRELILQFAISGRLVEQKDDDTCSSDLIEANKRRKRELIENKELKRKADPRPVQQKEFPWELPKTWSWVRLGAVTNYGDAPKIEFKDVTSDTWVLELEDIEKVSSKLLKKVFASERKFKSTKNRFPCGAVLYGKLRPYLDKVLIADTEGVCSTEISPISFYENINANYLRWYLKSPFFISYADGSTYGMNLPRLGTDSAREALFPFPPLEEQARIVAKVDELMALCDQLEAQQQERRTLQNQLRQATLQAFATSQSPHELKESWQRLQSNFGQLFSAPEDIRLLREIIYDLAVKGYLVSQEENGENADSLLNDIDRIKAKLIEEKQFKRSPKLESELLTEPELRIPSKWRWSRLIDLGEINPRNDFSDHEQVTFLPMKGVSEQYQKPLEGELTSWEKIKKGYTHFCVGDVLLAKITPCFENGKSALVSNITTKGGAGSTEFHVFRALPTGVLPEYVYIFLKSPLFRIDGEASMTGTAGQKRLPTEYFALRPIPLPPRKEQERIISKVNKLMVLCDTLESSLKRKNVISSNMVAASIASLTGIAIEQDEEPMKAPQTELVAPVRLGTPPDVKAQAPLATILARHKGEMSAKDLWQRFGGDIDVFYAQLKTEVAHGWILEPKPAEMLEKLDS